MEDGKDTSRFVLHTSCVMSRCHPQREVKCLQYGKGYNPIGYRQKFLGSAPQAGDVHDRPSVAQQSNSTKVFLIVSSRKFYRKISL